jgi:2,3-bisphosphoglycerate-dependent phosphoglycerate mutase
MKKPTSPSALQTLMFVRHGATEPNLAGLRCGGDLDVPLSAQGRTQAHTTAQQMRAMGWPVGLLVTSDLQRTRETARIINGVFPEVDLIIAPGFAERHLGEWNLLPISETEAALNAGLTPPGGESRVDFFDRIASAVDALLPRLSHLNHPPLLVASKGVARVLGELLSGQVQRDAAAEPRSSSARSESGAQNGELLRFELAPYAQQFAARCNA